LKTTAEGSLERNKKATQSKTDKSKKAFSRIHEALAEDRKLTLGQNQRRRRTMSS